GGLMTDWGVHEIDIALYAMQATAPKSVLASGGKFAYPDDASETPDTMQAIYEYEGFTMLWEHALGIDGGNYGKTEGIAFIGNDATLVVNRGGLELIPEVSNNNGMREFRTPDIPDQYRQGNYLDRHTQNFIEAIQNNTPDTVNCSIREGHIAAINAHMGNIALKTGHKLYWDATANTFKDDAQANQLMRVEYHNGWKLPKG
ncbi:MAG: gfo/Idh/MocA family oxidoreductase, partial [Phaeodactylibacter sp.]|nr:gfo/Idh/MocA family oxidoreductase [Phaeodactylibacter sp.]